RFLSETLVQQPVLLMWLHRPVQRDGLERLKSHEDLNEEFARFEATAFDLPPALALARFKRREYLRITLRDVLGLATLADNCLELSTLADVLLARALRISEQRLQNLYGTPQFTDEAGRIQPASLTILSMGKLGAQELNYSSDIDLMFLYSRDGETSGGTSGVTTNTEYFVRLAQMILKFVTEPTPEGAVFRVDLRLRPQGSEGDVVISLPSALDYYRRQGRHWELQALIKARCSAGDPATAAALLSELRPLIYPPEPDPAALESVLAVREEISRGLHRSPGELTRDAGHAAAWNVKLSPGGIRDIEFLVQCLARLYGGADPWLRTPSTLVGLQRLHDKDYITSRDFFRLGSAYEFLRRVEHRLQLRDGLQRHTLPEAPDALDRLARRCDIEAPAHTSPGEELKNSIQRHFDDVQEIYQRIILAQRPKLALARAQERRGAATTGEPAGPERAEGDSLFPQLRRVREDYPQLARALSQIFPGADPTARRGLTRFLGSIFTRPDAARRLADSPASLAGLAALFSHSEYAVEMLCRHPEEFVLSGDPRSHLAPPGLAAAGHAAALRIAYRTQSFAAL
ncbi:MAG TPA: glutamine-synthetase adenylyltransferase, partial [bacterium]